MARIDELLEIGAGPIEPTFDLADVMASGDRLRRRRHYRFAAAMAACFVLIAAVGVALNLGNSDTSIETLDVVGEPNQPEQPDGPAEPVATSEDGETDEAPLSLSTPAPVVLTDSADQFEPWFVRTGQQPAGTLHLPSFFDQPPMSRAEIENASNVFESRDVAVHMWRLNQDDPQSDPRTISINLRDGTICLQLRVTDTTSQASCAHLGTHRNDGVLAILGSPASSSSLIVLAREIEDLSVNVSGEERFPTAGIIAAPGLVPDGLVEVNGVPDGLRARSASTVAAAGAHPLVGDNDPQTRCVRLPHGLQALTRSGDDGVLVEGGARQRVSPWRLRSQDFDAAVEFQPQAFRTEIAAIGIETGMVLEADLIAENTIGIRFEAWADRAQRIAVLNEYEADPRVISTREIHEDFEAVQVTLRDPAVLDVRLVDNDEPVEFAVDCEGIVLDLRPPVPITELNAPALSPSEEGDWIGRLRIPAFGLDEPIRSGWPVRFLRNGVYQDPTATTGSLVLRGDVAETPPLELLPMLEIGKVIVVSTTRGADRYQVVEVLDGPPATGAASDDQLVIITVDGRNDDAPVSTVIAERLADENN